MNKKIFFIFFLFLISISVFSISTLAINSTVYHNVSLSNSGSLTEKRGLCFTMNANYTLKNASVNGAANPTNAYLVLASSPGSNLATATVTSQVAPFDYNLTKGTKYCILFDKGGASYTATNEGGSGITGQSRTELNWTGCYYSSAVQNPNCVAVNLYSVGLTNDTISAAPLVDTASYVSPTPSNATTLSNTNVFTINVTSTITNYSYSWFRIYNATGGTIVSYNTTNANDSLSSSNLSIGDYSYNVVFYNTTALAYTLETRNITLRNYTGEEVTVYHNITLNSGGTISETKGMCFTMRSNYTLKNITTLVSTTGYFHLAYWKTAGSSYSSSDYLLNVTLSSNTYSNTSYNLTSGNRYCMLLDNNGGTYASANEGGSSVTNITRTELYWDGCYYGSQTRAPTCVAVNIVSLGLSNLTSTPATPPPADTASYVSPTPSNATTLSNTNIFTINVTSTITNYSYSWFRIYNVTGGTIVSYNTTTANDSLSSSNLSIGNYSYNVVFYNTTALAYTLETRNITLQNYTAPFDFVVYHNVTMNNAFGVTEAKGLCFIPAYNFNLTNVTRASVCTGTTAYLSLSSTPTTTIVSASFVGNTATFTSANLTKGVEYCVRIGSGGSTYDQANEGGSSITNIVRDQLNWTGCYYSSAVQRNCVAINVYSLGLTNGTAPPQPHVDSASYISPTPSNGSLIYGRNFTINITTDITNFSYNYFRLYNASGSLINTTNISSANTSVSYYSIPYGNYSFNVLTYNITGLAYTLETRNITVQRNILLERPALHFRFDSNWSTDGNYTNITLNTFNGMSFDNTLYKTGTGAAYFDGDSWLGCSNCTVPLRTGQYNTTTCFWIYRNDTTTVSTYEKMIRWASEGTPGAIYSMNYYYGNWGEGTGRYLHFTSRSAGAYKKYDFTKDAWTHLCYRYDAGLDQDQIIVNGSLYYSLNVGTGKNLDWSSGQKLGFGISANKADGDSCSAEGTCIIGRSRMDDVRHYEFYLSDAQIALIYNGGLGTDASEFVEDTEVPITNKLFTNNASINNLSPLYKNTTLLGYCNGYDNSTNNFIAYNYKWYKNNVSQYNFSSLITNYKNISYYNGSTLGTEFFEGEKSYDNDNTTFSYGTNADIIFFNFTKPTTTDNLTMVSFDVTYYMDTGFTLLSCYDESGNSYSINDITNGGIFSINGTSSRSFNVTRTECLNAPNLTIRIATGYFSTVNSFKIYEIEDVLYLYNDTQLYPQNVSSLIANLSGVFSKGDIWSFSCVVTNITNTSSYSTSSALTIINTPPVVSESLINYKFSVFRNTSFNYKCAAYDADNDTLTFNISIFANNTLNFTQINIPAGQNSIEGVEFFSSDVTNYTKGTIINGSCFVNDGSVSSSVVSSETYSNTLYRNKTVLNSPPTINSSRISPIPAYGNDTLRGYASAYDIDEDTILYTYEWYRNNSQIDIQSVGYYPQATEQLLGSTPATRYLYNFTLRVIAFDGTNYSSYLNSSQLTISTWFPSTTTFNFSDTLSRQFNWSGKSIQLNCTSPSNTVDNLQYYFTYNYTPNGTNINLQTNGSNLFTFNHTYEQANVTFSCTASNIYETDGTKYINLSIDGLSPRQLIDYSNHTTAIGDLVSYTVMFNDTNLDDCVFNYNNGLFWETPIINTSCLNLQNWTVYKTITTPLGFNVSWNFSANDTLGNYMYGNTSTFEIGNAKPYINEVVFNSSTLIEGQNVTANCYASDSDPETILSYDLLWYVNNLNVYNDTDNVVPINMTYDCDYGITTGGGGGSDATCKYANDGNWSSNFDKLIFDMLYQNYTISSNYSALKWKFKAGSIYVAGYCYNESSTQYDINLTAVSGMGAGTGSVINYTLDVPATCVNSGNILRLKLIANDGIYESQVYMYNKNATSVHDSILNSSYFTPNSTITVGCNVHDGLYLYSGETNASSMIVQAIPKASALVNISHVNSSLSQLIGYCNASDANNDKINFTYKWTLNNVTVSSGYYNNSVNSNGVYFNVANYSNPTRGIWNLNCTPHDHIESGIEVKSNNIMTFDLVAKTYINNATLSNVTFYYNNDSRSYSESDGTLTIPLELTLHSFNLSKSHYYTTYYNFTPTNTSDLTQYIYMNANLNVTLWNEMTNGPFNISGTSNLYMSLFCTSNEKVVDLNAFQTNVSIDCDFDRLRVNVEYGNVTAAFTSYFRGIILDPENLDQKIYLIDLYQNPIVINDMGVLDLLQDYINPRMILYKWINGSLVQILGEPVDIENKVTAALVQNQEYQVYVLSDNQPTRVIGSYVATGSGSKLVRLYDITLSQQSSAGVTYARAVSNVSNLAGLIVTYNDPSATTSSINIVVRNSKTDVVLLNDTAYGNNIDYLFNPTPVVNDPLTNKSLKVTICRLLTTGITVCDIPDAYYNATLNQENNLVTDFKTTTNEIFGTKALDWFITLILSAIALAFTIPTGNFGSIVIIGIGITLKLIGLYSLGWSVIILGLVFTAILFAKKESELR